MKKQTISMSKFFPGGEWTMPSFFEIKGEGTGKEDYNIDLAISNGRDMVNLCMSNWDQGHFKMIRELHAAIGKAIDYNETMMKMMPKVDPLKEMKEFTKAATSKKKK